MKKIFSLLLVALFSASMWAGTKTLYLVPNSNWTQANARFAAYVYGSGDAWYSMTAFADRYQVTIDDKYPSIIFCRMNGSTTENNWDNKWNQTGDLTVPTDDKNCFTIPDGDWNGSTTGWGTYTPPADPVLFYVTGDSALVVDAGKDKSKAWNSDAIESKKDTIILSLKANQDYLLKVVVGGVWKGFGDLTAGQVAEGLTNDKDGNICFRLAAAGDVKVIYTASLFKVEGNFYVAPKETLKLVPGVWAADSAKFGAWTWSKTLGGQWSPLFAGSGDTLSTTIRAAADSLLLIRFRKDVTAPRWNAENDTVEWNRIDKIAIDHTSLTYTITDWDKGQWTAYTPEPNPAKFYVTGDSALVVDAGVDKSKAWDAKAIESKKDTLVLTLKANQDYIINVTDGTDWQDFFNLTDTAAGLKPMDNGYGGNNIGFRLAAAGDVKVIYKAGEIFKLDGNFYVAPAPEAHWYLAGAMTNWDTDKIEFAEGSAKVTLLADSTYEFKIEKIVGTDTLWYGNDGIMTEEYHENWTFTAPNDNARLRTKAAGEYTFALNTAGADPLVSVTFPAGPAPEFFYLTGDTAFVVAAGLASDKAWHADAIKVTGTEYQLNMPVGSYKVKLTLNGEFKDGEIKGFYDLTESVAGLSADADANICFTLAEAGKVTITYTGSVFRVEGSFYVAPVVTKTLKLVPGVWNADGAKFAVWTWGESVAGKWSEFFAGAGDTLSVQIPADPDSIAFIRFKDDVAAPTWEDENVNIWNKLDKIKIDFESLVYTITDWDKGQWTAYKPEPTPEAHWYLSGSMTEWDANKIEFAGSAIKVILLADSTYEFKIEKIAGTDTTWYGNDGIMNKEYHADWTFTTAMDQNGQIKTDLAGEYSFSINIDGEGNPHVTVVYPGEGSGIDIIRSNKEATKTIRNGQIVIIRGDKVYDITGRQL